MQSSQQATTGGLESKSDYASAGAVRYQVASVDKASGPSGADGDDWYCYVLKGGRSPIRGWRRGTLHEVQAHATRCAEELNERASGKRRSPWAPQKSK